MKTTETQRKDVHIILFNELKPYFTTTIKAKTFISRIKISHNYSNKKKLLTLKVYFAGIYINYFKSICLGARLDVTRTYKQEHL